MGWSNFFLVCFLVGLALSVISLFAGAFHLHLPSHWGRLPIPGHVQVPHGGPTTLHTPHLGVGQHGALGTHISPFNFATLMAFVTWFGGVGYLMTSVYRFWFLAALVIATMAGFLGASIVFWFFLKVLLAHDHTMNPHDFAVVGVVGTITSPIREQGTGELVYAQGGSRKAAAARAEDGQPIPRGTEVAVVRYEKGIAYVRPWHELAGESSSAVGNSGR